MLKSQPGDYLNRAPLSLRTAWKLVGLWLMGKG